MTIETLCYGFGLIEGPRVDADDNLYFSDVPNGGVYRRAPDGEIETVVPKRRGVGGIALHASGGIVVSGRNICHVKDGETRVLFDPDGIPGFNDIYTDAAGRVYAGSLRYVLDDPGSPPQPGELWRIDAEGEAVELYGGVRLSNGVGLSPDHRTIYHSDTTAGHVIAHDVTADGAVSNRRVFAEIVAGRPDGLAVDERGGVWIAAIGDGSVSRYGLDGKLDRRIKVPAVSVTSLCFGGSDGRDMYIVTSDNTQDEDRGGTVFRTRVDVAGVPAPMATI
ncbi:MAG: SMP-30/gluconolactonase/LRE family protein [Dehalococcoidia bacterium]|nr:SMP-30/gluconolactonase/LRE family protein [Dehalococcoidia bacterium]